MTMQQNDPNGLNTDDDESSAEFLHALKETISYDESELVHKMQLSSFRLTDFVVAKIDVRLLQADVFMIQQAIHAALCRVRGASHPFHNITDTHVSKRELP